MEILCKYEGVKLMKSVEFVVECTINDLNVTKGNKYEVYQEDEKYYWIKKNRYGASSFYPKKWFKKVDETTELNIIEAMKMPIGTEFEVIIDGEKYNMIAKISKSKQDNNEKELVWDNRAYIKVSITESILNAKFIQIQKPVTFQEVIDKDCILCRVEHEHMNGWLSLNSLEKAKEYLEFNQLMELLSELPSDELKVVLKYGRWYIKEI
jgi:hypothetical protein